MKYDTHYSLLVLCNRLRQRRRALGLTQAEVAALVGMKQANYSRMESGRQMPGLDTLLPVLSALRLELQVDPCDNTTYHVMYLDLTVADVVLSHDKKDIQFRKYEADGLRQPFSGNKLDLERFYSFLKSRCYEEDRADLDLILKKAGLRDNNPYAWVRLTHGVTYDDFFWIRTNNEQIMWDEVRIR